MRRRLAALAFCLVLATSGAGCFGGDGGDDDPPAGDDGGPGGPVGDGGTGGGPEPLGPTRIVLLDSFSFTECDGVSFHQGGEYDRVQGMLPEGFTAKRVEGGLDAAPEAYLYVDLYRCQSFATPNVQFNETWYGLAYTLIEPPEAYPDVTADRHEYVFQMLAGGDILAQLWPAAGYATYNGTASMEMLSVVGTAGQVEMRLGDYHTLFATAPDGDIDPATLARFGHNEDGQALIWTGQTDRSVVHAGPSQLTVPEDSPWAGLGLGRGNRLVGEYLFSWKGSFTENRLVVEVS